MVIVGWRLGRMRRPGYYVGIVYVYVYVCWMDAMDRRLVDRDRHPLNCLIEVSADANR